MIATTEAKPIATNRGEEGWAYVGADDRGVELEVIAVPQGDGLLIVHVMPTALRRN